MLSAVLLLSVWQPTGNVQAAEDALAGTNLLVQYEFQNGGEDSSGNGYDAIIGNGVTVANGVASLPGGEATDSAFIELPEGMFDAQNTLTITMWIKDNDPQENWLGAFFFGSAANSNGYPENYYYFVPCEKQHNTLKSVITNSINAAKPWDAEKGIRESVNTSAYRGVWTHYAIVLKPGKMLCYIDGEEVGSQTLDRTVSDFGSNLQSYIGKSNYADPLYQGDFKDFRVYTDELSEEQIQAVMGVKKEVPQYSMTIDGNYVTKQLSEDLYGLFYEDINSAADGGLYPEMVKNYSFENAYVQSGDTNSSYFKENGYQTIGKYDLHWTASSGSFSIEDSDSLNENNLHYAVVKGNAVLQNGGFAPKNDPNGAAMAIKPLEEAEQTGTYTFSAFAKAEAGYTGEIKVKIVNANGKAITDEQIVPFEADGEWQKISTELTSTVSKNTKGKMVLSIRGADASEKLQLDMVSVVPHDSFGYGDKNYAYGVGIRQDLLDLMMDLNPKFMRFPGGCIVEGFNWEGIYDWRDTVGPLEERKANTNRWENWGNSDHSWGYMQSFGFGYHEILSLCEAYGMEPFPIISAGVLCQYETSGVNAKTDEDLQFFIDMATDLLDYCWGDPATNAWAAKRAENGHKEPFDLKYLGIGNENLQDKYFANLEVMKEAVEEYVKENYPNRKLNIISSAGPTATGNDYEYAYDRLAQTMPGETLVDEHYYVDESFMYNQSDRYDYYQRVSQGGSDVFVGEYAVKNDNKYNTALAEAAYITGLERNADVVKNISYAPLLYKVGNLNWSHDLIYFDEFDTAKSTNYYVQQMFAKNYGTQLIDTKLESADKDFSNYGSPIIGTSSATGTIDKVTVYDAAGKILFEDDFEDNSNGWKKFSATGSGNSFSISNGELKFTGTNGINAVYLPMAVEEHWENYKIVVESAIKDSGKGFVIGAGHENQYYWYHLGKSDEAAAIMEVTRPNRNETALTTKILGNNFANKQYYTEDALAIKNNDAMEITFNYGVNGKLEASYLTEEYNKADTAKYAFSSDLHQYQTDIYQVVNKDENNVYVKLVNADAQKKNITLHLKNLNIDTKAQMEITMLKGSLDEANAIGNEVVAPVTKMQTISGTQIVYELPKYSVNIIRIPLARAAVQTPPTEDKQEEITGIAFADTSVKTLKVKAAYTRTAIATPVNAAIIYTSTNPSVASVDSQTGKVKAKKPGVTQIVASSNGKTASYTIQVKPGKVTIKKATAKSKKVVLKWNKISGATGYQITIAYNKKFKKAKNVNVKKGKTISKTVTKLKGGKKAYIKIRAYTKSGKTVVYGDYSKVKQIKIKK